jgi:hypothetical protein
MIKLKPCPFCNSKKQPRLSGVGLVCYWVECCNEKCFISGPDREKKDLAIKAWNKRRQTDLKSADRGKG